MKNRTLLSIAIVFLLLAILFDTDISNAQKKNNVSRKSGLVAKKQNLNQAQKVRKKEIVKKNDKGKYDEPNMFVEYQKMIRTPEGGSAPTYTANYLMEELNKAQEQKRLYKATNLNWIERGPGNVSGRTRGIIVDISDATNKTWFAGSASGGIWKTTDAGVTWINNTPNFPNLATTVLAQAAFNPDIIYCGTGEGFFNIDAVAGAGIFKSVDHGNTWNQLQSTANLDFAYVNRIIVDPNNPQLVLAATSYFSGNKVGISRSTDGGTTWTKVFTPVTNGIYDLKADPSNFSIQYCSSYTWGVYKSTDGGLSWNISSNMLDKSGRIELAVSSKNPNYIYASGEGKNHSSVLYVSEDKGENWWLVNSNSSSSPDWLKGQGWYDNSIAVSPFDENTVYLGGIDLWKVQITNSTSIRDIKWIDVINTSSFINFWMWTNQAYPGNILKGTDFFPLEFNYPPTFTSFMLQVLPSDYCSVEIRFGPGKSQKAHRFFQSSNTLWQYKDYVTVPFEVWDITNNRQLMVSFRDSENDGTFNLKEGYAWKEYIMIHSITYNASSPDPKLAVDNGILYKMIYAEKPSLPSGAVWNPLTLPDALIRINYGEIITRLANFSNLTDGYGVYIYGVPYVHVDHHSIVPVPIVSSPGTFWLINGNDGGVALSTDGGTSWSETLSSGYNTTQFYGVDKKPGASEYIGGTQDNGTWISPNGQSPSKTTAYTQAIGGDGMDVVWHYKDPNKIIASNQYNNFFRTTNGGLTWTSATNGLKDVGGPNKGNPFISRIGKSNSDPDVIFTTGYTGIWRSEDFGASWALCSIESDKYTSDPWRYYSGGSTISTPITVSIADPQIVWAGGGRFLSTDGGITFSHLFNGRTGTNISTHPNDKNVAFVTSSVSRFPKIYRTTDLGNSWTDITGFTSNNSSTISKNGFPNVVTYCVLVMPYNTNIIWAGTEIGLFESIDNGTTWHPANNGLPSVCIWDMKIVDDQVVLATHGRGIWSVTLSELSTYQPPVVTLSPFIITLNQGIDKAVNITAKLRSAYDSTLVMMDGQKVFKLNSTIAGDNSFKFTPTKSGTVTIQLFSYSSAKIYKSYPKTLVISGISAIEEKNKIPANFSLKQNYPNPFNPVTVISFSIPISTKVLLNVFDSLGKEVVELVNEEKTAGTYEINFDGSKLSSGVYFYKIQAGKFLSVKKMIIMK